MNYQAVGFHDFYTFLLVFARIGGVIVAAPVLGNQAIPRPLKAGLTLIFALAITPMAASMTGPIPTHIFLFIAAVAKDALFGMALGYISRILFSAVEMAGYFADTQMGFGFVNLVNPFSEHQESILSSFQFQLAITVYLLANGHLILLGSLVESFGILAPGNVSPNAAFGMMVLPLLRLMFILALKLAMPALGVLMVVDVAFGLMARAVPQLNVFLVGTPAKIIIGVTVVALTMPVTAIIVGQITTGTAAGLSALLAASK